MVPSIWFINQDRRFILNNLTVSSKSFKGEGEVALAMEGSEPANYEYTLEGSVSDAKVLTLKANVPVPMGMASISISFRQKLRLLIT